MHGNRSGVVARRMRPKIVVAELLMERIRRTSLCVSEHIRTEDVLHEPPEIRVVLDLIVEKEVIIVGDDIGARLKTTVVLTTGTVRADSVVTVALAVDADYGGLSDDVTLRRRHGAHLLNDRNELKK